MRETRHSNVLAVFNMGRLVWEGEISGTLTNNLTSINDILATFSESTCAFESKSISFHILIAQLNQVVIQSYHHSYASSILQFHL